MQNSNIISMLSEGLQTPKWYILSCAKWKSFFCIMFGESKIKKPRETRKIG